MFNDKSGAVEQLKQSVADLNVVIRQVAHHFPELNISISVGRQGRTITFGDSPKAHKIVLHIAETVVY